MSLTLILLLTGCAIKNREDLLVYSSNSYYGWRLKLVSEENHELNRQLIGFELSNVNYPPIECLFGGTNFSNSYAEVIVNNHSAKFFRKCFNYSDSSEHFFYFYWPSSDHDKDFMESVLRQKQGVLVVIIEGMVFEVEL